jgi:hypothetical protein
LKIPANPPSLHQHEHNNCHRHTNHLQKYCSELLCPAIGVTLTRFNELRNISPGIRPRAFLLPSNVNEMKTESTLLKIEHELIGMFASLDAWFDELLDDGMSLGQETDYGEVITHILFSNYRLLNILPDKALDELHHDYKPTDQSLYELRSALRDQLYQSLLLIDSLEESSALNRLPDEKKMDLYDRLFSIAQHLRYHLELLELSEDFAE